MAALSGGTRLVYDPEQQMFVSPERAPRRGKSSEQFIPAISIEWFVAAGALPGKAPMVGGIIRMEMAKRKCREVRFTGGMTERHGIDRASRNRAIRALENAGLIHVRRNSTGSPLISLPV
jgi:hypothetical protein